jgi:2-oxoisovalerate dehydrogenase E1 component
MHLADPAIGILGANGIVAAGLPIATGAGLACELDGTGRVVVAFFGDGAVAQGAFHEAANLAAEWRLPVLFCCENNHYAEFSTTEGPATLAARAAGYGMKYWHADGNDVEDVVHVTAQALKEVRARRGPVFVEAETHRLHGHYEGDPQKYRTPELDELWGARDPIELARKSLSEAGVGDAQLTALEGEVSRELEVAEERAKKSAPPSRSGLLDYVYARRPLVVEVATMPGEEKRYSHAIRAALTHELETDPSVVVFGVDVGAGGNVFGLTRGLHERWPDRVRDAPISETGIIGAGVGAAMAGLRPVVELMYVDFLGVCLDQMLNQAAKMRFMTGGAAEVPLVIRTQFGAGRSSGSQHSQSLEAMLAHIPGLTVVMPSSITDTYGLLRAAIQDPNPVVFIENRLLYEKKGRMPPLDHLVPIGSAKVIREGADVTLVSWSRMVHDCLAAATTLADEGIDVEVVDLRTITPLDRATVLKSLAKTNRMVIAQEAVTDFGVGAEIAALAVNEGFCSLDAPVRRVGAPFSPAPYAPNLESLWLPDPARIAQAVRDVAAF